MNYKDNLSHMNYTDNLSHMNYIDNLSHMNYIDNLSPTTWRGLFTGARTSWSVFMVATGKYVDKKYKYKYKCSTYKLVGIMVATCW